MNGGAESRPFWGIPPVTLLLIAAVVVGAVALGLFARSSLNRIHQDLPLAVLQQQRDVAGLNQDINGLMRAVEDLRAVPSEDSLAAARRSLDTADRRLRVLRDRSAWIRGRCTAPSCAWPTASGSSMPCRAAPATKP